jgi:hypothetical protein
VFPWYPLEGSGQLDDLVAKGRDRDQAVRAVAAAALYSLREGNPTDGFDALQSALGDLAGLLPVEGLTDPAQLRWELHLAASAGSLERAVRVGRRLTDVDPVPDVLALAARTLFLLAHPSLPSVRIFGPSCFDSGIRYPGSLPTQLCDLFVYLLAVTVEKRRTFSWADPSTFVAPVLPQSWTQNTC